MNIIELSLIFCAFFGIVSSSTYENALSITIDQMQELAGSVCDDNFYGNETSVSICKGNFIKATEENTIVKEAPRARLRCQTAKTLTVAAQPSEQYRLLIAFVPADDDEAIVQTSYLEKNESITEIYTPQSGQLWSSYLLEDGTPLGWSPGALVPTWSESDQRTYDIELERDFEVKNDSGRVDVVFRWNSSDEADSCFSVRNHCDHLEMGNIQQQTIKPGFPMRFVVKNLKLDDHCKVIVKGKYGVSTLEYKTPSCEMYADFCAPEIPELVITSSRSYSGVGWDVTVGWQDPKRPPIRYNVTLRANQTYTTPVPGHRKNVTFREVIGDRLVSVTVVAVGKTASAVTNRRAFLAPIEESASIGIVMGGAWSGMLLVAVSAMLLYVWLQRRRRDKLKDIYSRKDLDYKLSKEGSSTTFSTEITMAEDHWELRPERLLLHEVIGEGAFGVVRRATLAPGAKEVAVKMLKEFPSIEEIRSFRCEMEVMKSVGAHPHVVSLVGCCSGHRPYIVAEYCHKGNLLHFLRCAWDIISLKRTAKYYNNNIECSIDYRDDLLKPTDLEHSKIVVNKLYDLQKLCDMELTSVDLLSFCRQIAMGMEFLSSNRVVHRDLAARNVLVTNDKTLKIADFGLSRDVYQENQYKQKGLGKLPIKWMALESLTQRMYTTHSDVWSFGVVIWEVVTVGGSPYSGVPASRLPRLLRAGYRMPKPTNCSKQLYDIMLSCWHNRPQQRPTFGELHRAFDALLNCACADEYLSLELDVEDAPPPPSMKYFSLLPRKSRYRCRKESYERPLKAPQSNHYTSPPASQPRPQFV